MVVAGVKFEDHGRAVAVQDGNANVTLFVLFGNDPEYTVFLFGLVALCLCNFP